jgi:hypothetical protein
MARANRTIEISDSDHVINITGDRNFVRVDGEDNQVTFQGAADLLGKNRDLEATNDALLRENHQFQGQIQNQAWTIRDDQEAIGRLESTLRQRDSRINDLEASLAQARDDNRGVGVRYLRQKLADQRDRTTELAKQVEALIEDNRIKDEKLRYFQSQDPLALGFAQERIRGLEKDKDALQKQLEHERERLNDIEWNIRRP